MLLAEDSLFVIGAIEFQNATELPTLEAAASLQLADQLADAGAKRWDAYLVMLSSAAATERGMSEDVTDIVYNTRYLRRLIRWGVTPTEASLADALRLFLPLPVPGMTGPVDPVQMLADRLPSRGVNPDSAAAAFAQWRGSEGRDDD